MNDDRFQGILGLIRHHSRVDWRSFYHFQLIPTHIWNEVSKSFLSFWDTKRVLNDQFFRSYHSYPQSAEEWWITHSRHSNRKNEQKTKKNKKVTCQKMTPKQPKTIQNGHKDRDIVYAIVYPHYCHWKSEAIRTPGWIIQKARQKTSLKELSKYV